MAREFVGMAVNTEKINRISIMILSLLFSQMLMNNHYRVSEKIFEKKNNWQN